MDNQQNTQNQNNQIPVNQEPPVYQEPPSPILEPEEAVPSQQIPEQPSEPTEPSEIPPQPIPESQLNQSENTNYKNELLSEEDEENDDEDEDILESSLLPPKQAEKQPESVDDAAAKYQQILDEYAASQKQPEPEPQPQPEPEPELPPQPELSPQPNQLSPEPQPQPEPELPPIPSSDYQSPVNETPSYVGSENDEPQTNVFKTLFIIILFINIIIFAAVGLIYYKTNQNKENSNQPEENPTPESSITCTLNDTTYKLGESFPSDDSCNTCSCTETGEIVCTERACDITPTKAATKSATKVTITPTKSATKSAIPKIAPDKVVLTFYQGYIKSSQGINAYKNSPYLTQSFQDKLTKDYSNSTGGGADAILMAQDTPKTFTSKIIKQDSTTATVNLTESNGWSQTLTVNLIIVNDQWKIDSVSLND